MNSPLMAMSMSMSSGTLEAALAIGDSGEDEKIFPYFQEMYMYKIVCLVLFNQTVQCNKILLTVFLRC